MRLRDGLTSIYRFRNRLLLKIVKAVNPLIKRVLSLAAEASPRTKVVVLLLRAEGVRFAKPGFVKNFQAYFR